MVGFGAATSAGNLRVRAVQRATVCRFAQCAGCENSRNAVHDTVSRWVATRHVCYFVAARVPGFHPSRIFLFPATSSFGSSSRGRRRLTTRNDIHPVQINPNMLTLRFLRRKWTRLDRISRRHFAPSFRDLIFFFFFCLSLGNFRNAARTRDAISRNYGIT